MTRFRRIAIAALLLAACRPPEAPEEFDDLVVWLYAHHQDEDTASMEVGVDALLDWTLEQEEIEDQYEITSLGEETVDALDEVDRSAEEMVGLAVVTASEYEVDDAAYAMIVAEIDDVYPDTFVEYERQWDGDPDCFMSHECARLEARENYEAHYPLGLETIAESWNQYVWIEAQTGPTFVQRNWLVHPPETNSELLEVDEQMYLNMFVPWEGGGHRRLQATWMIVTQDEIDDSLALNVTGRSMRDNSETLDEYMAGL